MRQSVEVRHMRREVKTALELAIVALAPSDIINPLATSAGLLEAIAELPADSAPALALNTTIIVRAQRALKDWQAWQTKHLPKGSA